MAKEPIQWPGAPRSLGACAKEGSIYNEQTYENL